MHKGILMVFMGLITALSGEVASLFHLHSIQKKVESSPLPSTAVVALVSPTPVLPAASVSSQIVVATASASPDTAIHPTKLKENKKPDQASSDGQNDDQDNDQEKPKKKSESEAEGGEGADGLQLALEKKYGEHASFTVGDLDGKYAQGTLGKKNGQGKWWLAAQDPAGNWTVVTDGYSYVDCAQIAHYQFPSKIVPVCWSNAKNTLVNR